MLSWRHKSVRKLRAHASLLLNEKANSITQTPIFLATIKSLIYLALCEQNEAPLQRTTAPSLSLMPACFTYYPDNLNEQASGFQMTSSEMRSLIQSIWRQKVLEKTSSLCLCLCVYTHICLLADPPCTSTQQNPKKWYIEEIYLASFSSVSYFCLSRTYHFFF